MKSYRLYQVDAFSDTVFGGNPAGVVTNADGLSDTQMQKIARELNNSETAFWLKAKSEDHDGEIRYFTPTTEVPICGHATIAAMYAKAEEAGQTQGVLRIKTGAGILPFETRKVSDETVVIMTQGQIEYGNVLSGSQVDTLMASLGLAKNDFDQRLPVEIVSTGHSKVMVGVKSREVLNGLSPDLSALKKLSEEIGCNGYFVFTLDFPDSDVLVYGRMFAPAIGINEDPVTGNANGPLGAYLVKHGVLNTVGESVSFNAVQGEAIGRSGKVKVEVGLTEGKASKIRVSGTAVTVFETTLRL